MEDSRSLGLCIPKGDKKWSSVAAGQSQKAIGIANILYRTIAQ